MTTLPMNADSPIEELIGQTLIEMLREKELADISVKELASRAHIARSTFYAHYRNVDEVLRQIEDAIVADLVALNEPIADPSRSSASDMSFFRATMDYLDENREVMGVLLVERPDTRFIEAWKDGIKGHLRKRMPLQADTPEGGLAFEVAASAMIASWTHALKSGSEPSPDFACDIIADVLQLLERRA